MSEVQQMPGDNYFAERHFIKTNPKTGVARNRSGTRMLSLTTDFLIGLRKAMIAECGPAANLDFRSSGRKWGEMFAKRFDKEMSDFYQQPLKEMPMYFFEACVLEAFSHHGWGSLRMDYTKYDKGIIVAELQNALYSGLVENPEEPSEALMTGILAGFFSYFAQQPLDAVQTHCETRGDSVSRFVISLATRMEEPIRLQEEGATSEAILAALEKNVA